MPIKKLKVLHSQGFDSHTQAFIHIPKPIPPIVNTQPPPTVNTQPTILPTQIPIADLDSDEEQDLQFDVLNLITNLQPTNNFAQQAEQASTVEPSIAEPSTTEPPRAKITTTAIKPTIAEQTITPRA